MPRAPHRCATASFAIVVVSIISKSPRLKRDGYLGVASKALWSKVDSRLTYIGAIKLDGRGLPEEKSELVS